MDGRPLEGVRVVRALDYDQVYEDEAVTGEDGAFRFPGRTIRSDRPDRMMDGTVVRQTITAHHQGQEYLLWYTMPGTTQRRAGITGRLSSMWCELTDPETEQTFDNAETPQYPHHALSICRWPATSIE